MGEVIQSNNYGSPESSLKTSGSDIIRLVRQAHEAGINDEVPTFAAGLFKRAIDVGYGPEEHVALIKILRRQAEQRLHINSTQGGQSKRSS